MPASHLLADGRERLLQSPEVQAELAAAEAAIRARYAPSLAAASFFRRVLLHLEINRELAREIAKIEQRAPESALYFCSGQ